MVQMDLYLPIYITSYTPAPLLGLQNIYMIQGQQQPSAQLINLIEFAIFEKRHQDVVNLINNLLSQSQQYPTQTLIQMHIRQAQAHSHLQKQTQTLRNCDEALKLGAPLSSVYHLKMRAYLENTEIQEAEKVFQQLLDSNPEFKRLIDMKKALQILKDDREIYCLEKEEQIMFDQMKTLLYKAGSSYDKLKVGFLAKGYRGVVATKAIRKKQPIVYIPKSQIITLQMAKRNPFCQAILNSKMPLLSPKHTFISIFLLEEKKNSNSKWRHYIDLLPVDHSCFPINFKNEELGELVGSPFLFMIHEKVMDLRRDYDTILKADRGFEKYSFKEFCWARMMVGSRIFGLNITGVKTEVLVPFADMLNHRLPKQTAWNYVESMNGFLIESLEDIEIGQEVFDSYGRKCNSRFLLNYGFVIPSNKDNQITLRVSFDEDDEFAEMKKSMMHQKPQNGGIKLMKVSLSMNNNKFYELMGLLRFICVNELETLQILSKISNIEITQLPYQCIRTPPISMQNQIRVWKRFGELCQRTLHEYPNTIEEDRQLLKSGKLSSNLHNIIVLRMGEKYILTEFICISEQVVAILESSNFVQILLKQSDKLYFKYMHKILSLMPGVDKSQLTKQEIKQNEEEEEEEEEDTEERI